MDQQKNGQEMKRGPIHMMFDWTLALITIAVIIGLAWKYLIKPLYLG